MKSVSRKILDKPDAADGAPLPPSDVHSEQAVIGSILLDNDQFEKVSSMLRPEDFYVPAHQIIYGAIASLIASRNAADIVTVSKWLLDAKKLEDIGGHGYIAALCAETPHAVHVESYGRVVRDEAILRNLAKCAQEIQRNVYNREGLSAVEILSNAQQRIFELSKVHSKSAGLVHVGKSAAEALEQIAKVHEMGPDSLVGVPTGFTDLDDITSGLQRSNLIIIAGRPSMGKTTLAMNIAEFAAVKEKMTVAFFSLEMSDVELTMRMLSSLSSIDSKRIRDGNLGESKRETMENWEQLTAAVQMLEEAPVYIDSTTDISPVEIVARSRRLKHEVGLDMVIIDYLQMLQVHDMDSNRATELANITRSLKNLARELDVPVIALSQLNRNVETRPNKRPMLADLRESGAIEQDADVILFIYREEAYDPQTEDYGTAEINVAKHRNGETRKFKLTFLSQYTRFNDHANEDQVWKGAQS